MSGYKPARYRPKVPKERALAHKWTKAVMASEPGPEREKAIRFARFWSEQSDRKNKQTLQPKGNT